MNHIYEMVDDPIGNKVTVRVQMSKEHLIYEGLHPLIVTASILRELADGAEREFGKLVENAQMDRIDEALGRNGWP